MKTEVATAVYGPADALNRLQLMESDLCAVGRITGEVSWIEAEGPVAVDVTLATGALRYFGSGQSGTRPSRHALT